MLVLAINDHWAKAVFHNEVTGKLSDVAGLLFFPLLLQGVGEWLGWVPVANRRVLHACILVTALVFTGIKVWEPAGLAYSVGVGWLQAPGRWLLGQSATPVRLVRDPSDLAALPVLAGTAWLGARRAAQHRRAVLSNGGSPQSGR
jgi:hypothetical protein